MDIDYGIYNNLVEEKKQILFQKALNTLTPKQFETVKLAFDVASHAHYKQSRKSGEPYITHPTEVATIICDWELDEQTIAGALLHDVVEDTTVTKSDLAQIFGNNVAELVDGVTKLEKINFDSEETAHAEYFQKVVLAMSKDIRVILIKLADRLHNMLTLGAMSLEKRKRIATETMEIYVPIANKIGLHKVHLDLAEECFKQLHPFRHNTLEKAVAKAQKDRLPIIKEILKNISGALKSNGISAQFAYRQRTIYNLYMRMLRRGQNFNRIYDMFEIKIVVTSIRDCYLTLGVLHSLYQPLPGKFKDYIAIPKSNGYQSLHSTLIGPKGTPIQIHIRTNTMEEIAEYGIISHWLKHKNDEEFLSAYQRTSSWISNILDIQSSSFSANEFLATLKQDLSPGDIYVFTPQGKIILLPKGSTPLDFAYYVHSDIGNHFQGAYINQKQAKINTKLQNGDIVEIITNQRVEPSDEWLEIVVSGKAISKIKQYIKEQRYDYDVSNGIKLINLGLSLIVPGKVVSDEELNSLLKNYYPKLSILDLEHQIGNGTIPALEIAKKILNIKKDSTVEINLNNCSIPVIQDPNCLAVPGEEILAQINKQAELVIHRKTCKQTRGEKLEKLTLVHIINKSDKLFQAKIEAVLLNRPGTFSKFANIVSKQNINIIELNQGRQTEEVALVQIVINVKNLEQIENLINKIRKENFIKNVSLI